MQLKYGSYSFDAGACKLATRAQTLWNEGGQPYAVRKRIDVDGFLTAEGQAAISVAMSALATALALPYKDLIFYHDGGTASATALINSTSTTGVQIVDGPHFPDSIGGEFVNFRRFTFAAEAEYPVTNSANLLLSFRERLTFSGGGPVYVHKLAINGLPQKQLVYPFSVYQAKQEGEAVGYLKTPNRPAPIWPAALIGGGGVTITAESPERRGKVAAVYDNFPITWSYSFESATPLTGIPHIWL